MHRLKLHKRIPKLRSRKVKKWFRILCTSLTTGLLSALIVVFILVPLIFKYSISLQRLLIFTNVNLPTSESYFAGYKEPGLRNFYVRVDEGVSKKKIFLGVWHLLPWDLCNRSVEESNYDYDRALATSNHSVVLYFHGSGEARSYQLNTYQVLREFFHVIAFDYRGYADSSKAPLSEAAIEHDCVQLYTWLLRYTDRIFVWGHSLGSSVAAGTAAALRLQNLVPLGLVLESPFTSLREELPVHPYGKIFSWLPWFKSTVLKPLRENKFNFDTAEYVVKIDCPIMILHAMDDEIVPYSLGQELYNHARDCRRTSQGKVFLRLFNSSYGYNHYFIYEAPELPSYIGEFMEVCDNYYNKSKHTKRDIESFGRNFP